MKVSRTQLALIAVAIIAVSIGGYMYYDNTQKEARKAERNQLWQTWSRTLYVGSTQGSLHPGIDLDQDWFGYFGRYTRAGKLYWIDPNSPDVKDYSPYMAESWELKRNAAGESYIEWKLKPGLKFPDGTDADANAVKYSWNYQQEVLPKRTKNGAPRQYFLDVSVKRVECPDKYTVWQFLPDELEEFLPLAFVSTQALSYGGVVSPESTDKYAQENSPLTDFAKQVGWGPLLLSTFSGSDQYTLVPWKDFPVNPLGGYKGPTKVTKLDKIVVTKYGDAASMRMALESGSVDIVGGKLNRADYKDLKSNTNVKTDEAPGLGYCQVLRLNYNFPPLNNTLVRRAINLVVQPEEIVDKVLYGTGTVANSVVRPFQPYYLPVFEAMRKRPIADRITEAKQLLAQAGYANGFETDLYYRESDLTRDPSTIIQAQLSKINIKVNIKVLESAAYLDGRNNGRFPMCWRGWTLDYNDPDSELWYQLYVKYGKDAPTTASATKVYGWNNVNNTEISKALEQGKKLYDPLGDPPERKIVYEWIQQQTYDLAIVLPVYYESMYEARRTWAEGYVMWKSIDFTTQGIWNAYKTIPTDWETRLPPS